jgi:hypothetical protein
MSVHAEYMSVRIEDKQKKLTFAEQIVCCVLVHACMCVVAHSQDFEAFVQIGM